MQRRFILHCIYVHITPVCYSSYTIVAFTITAFPDDLSHGNYIIALLEFLITIKYIKPAFRRMLQLQYSQLSLLSTVSGLEDVELWCFKDLHFIQWFYSHR